MNELNVTDEEVKKRFGGFKKIYEEDKSNNTFSALIMGLYGVGKTRILPTGRGPWLIDSFDPKGTVILEQLYPNEIKSGQLIIRKFWNENSAKPTQHKKWEEMFEEDKRIGLFNHIGTYAIDSFTTWLEAVANEVSVQMGRSGYRTNSKIQKLAIQDYPVIYDHAKDVIKDMSAFSCDFIVTAHLDRYQEEATGKLVTDIRTYKSLRTDLPLLFTEKYIMETKEVPINKEYPNGVKYLLYTSSAGTFRASTQLGASGKLSAVEEPNIKNILRKVGLTAEDKPNL